MYAREIKVLPLGAKIIFSPQKKRSTLLFSFHSVLVGFSFFLSWKGVAHNLTLDGMGGRRGIIQI